ncbi:MAG: Holliday junction branch migration protein RuvA, partial [Mariprofundaceae bacterium]
GEWSDGAMIGRLSGKLVEIDPAGLVVIEAGGVGYEVQLSLQTLCKLKVGEDTTLAIHTHVREDQITLFGFADMAERALFRRLTSVSGIGARMALNLMSGMPRADLVRAIESGDDASIARTPGIGKKTAQRLILELRGKLPAERGSAGASGVAAPGLEDVRSALANLGYKPAQIERALQSLDTAGTDVDFESLLRAALRALA